MNRAFYILITVNAGTGIICKPVALQVFLQFRQVGFRSDFEDIIAGIISIEIIIGIDIAGDIMQAAGIGFENSFITGFHPDNAVLRNADLSL